VSWRIRKKGEVEGNVALPWLCRRRRARKPSEVRTRLLLKKRKNGGQKSESSGARVCFSTSLSTADDNGLHFSLMRTIIMVRALEYRPTLFASPTMPVSSISFLGSLGLHLPDCLDSLPAAHLLEKTVSIGGRPRCDFAV
jgi:hypothetical protein